MDDRTPGLAFSPCEDGPGELCPAGDGYGPHYSAIADDTRNTTKEREAAMSFALAERHLEAEEAAEALEVATDAVTRYRELGEHFRNSVANALRLVLHCFRAQDKRKFADKMAKEELEIFEVGQDAVGAAKMMLSIAEINMVQRGEDSRKMAMSSAVQALEVFQEEQEKRMEAATYIALVTLYLKSRRDATWKEAVKKAIHAAQSAHALFEELEDPRGMARALHGLSTAYRSADMHQEAHEASKQAVGIFRKLGNPKMEAYELQTLALVALAAPKPQLALPFAEEAVAIFRKCACKLAWEASALSTLVRAHVVRGETRKAIQVAQSGLRRFQGALGDKHAESIALDALVYAFSCYGDTQGALTAAEKALAAFQELGDRRFEAMLVRTVAGLELYRGEADSALATAKAALDIFKELQDAYELAGTWMQIAEIRMSIGEVEAALKAVQESQNFYGDIGDKRGEAVALLLAASISFEQGTYDKAGSLAAQAHSLLRDVGERKGEASALKTLAEVQLARGEFEKARRATDMALEIWKEEQDRAGEANTLILAANAILKMILAPDFERYSFAFEESKDEALDNAVRAVAFGREIDDMGIVAAGLLTAAQVEVIDYNPEDALRDGEEACAIFGDLGDQGGEAKAQSVTANALCQLGRYEEAYKLLQVSLRTHQELLDPDGEAHVRSMIGELKQFWTPPASAKPKKGRKKAVVQESDSESGDDAPGATAGAVVPAQAKEEVKEVKLQKLDTSGGITNALLRARLREAVFEMGLEEVDDDSGLMNAGLTSGNTIMLKNVIEQDFPMMELPATLAFDYPSIGMIADYVMSMMENYKEA